ncbi:MAG: hypothetical protein ABIG39_07000 [Candidatus Micrarchaeota archaeon]
MKRYLLAIFATMLLFGCFGGPGGELNLIPDKANTYIVFKPSEILSDKEFMESVTTAGQQGDFMTELERMEEESGVNPYKLTKATIFLDSERVSGDYEYWGLIVLGEFDEQKVISKLKEKGTLKEEQYGGFTIYTTPANYKIPAEEIVDLPPRDSGASLAFINSGTFISGTMEALKDSIDVKNGKRQPLKDEGLDRVTTSVDKDAMLMLAIKVPAALEEEASDMSSSGPFDFSAFSKTTYLALSYGKAESQVSIKVSMLFKTPADATKVTELVEGLLLMSSSMLEDGSESKKLLKNIELSSSGDRFSISLDTTTEQLEKISDELEEMNSGSYGGPAYQDPYDDSYYDEPSDYSYDYEDPYN